jgi:hypothetical protein
MNCNQNRINNFISNYCQNDTLNIFGQNWQQTSPNSAICPEIGSITLLAQTDQRQIPDCGCGSKNIANDRTISNSDKTYPKVIDYICKLIQFFQNTSTTKNHILLQYSFFYTTNPSNPTNSDILFTAIQNYQISYITYINSSNVSNMNMYNIAKKVLYDLICGYIQNGTNIFNPDVAPSDANGLMCVFNEILETLCEKKCCENSCKKCKNCSTAKSCLNCSNNVLQLIEQLSVFFINFPSYIPNGQFETQLAVSSTVSTVTINVGNDIIYLYDFDHITFGIPPIFYSFDIGSTTATYVSAYINSLLCPCSPEIQSNLQTSINNLISLINLLIINDPSSGFQITFTELLTQPVHFGTELRNLANYGIPPNYAEWFSDFKQLLGQIVVGLQNCVNQDICPECKPSCENNVITSLYNLSVDIIDEINDRTTFDINNNYTGIWYAIIVAAFVSPPPPPPLLAYPTPNVLAYSIPNEYDPPITPGLIISNPGFALITSGSTTRPALSPPSTAFSYLQLQFINVGIYIDCNSSQQLYILVPDIVVVIGDGLGNIQNVMIPIGTASQTYYNAWIDFITGPCDDINNKLAFQKASVALEQLLCFDNICENVINVILENLSQTIIDDLIQLCCLIKKCDIICCKLSHIADFVTELINLDCKVSCHQEYNIPYNSNIADILHISNKRDCNNELAGLNDDFIQMFLDKNPSKCTDPRLLLVNMYETFFQLLDTQLCCIENRITRDEYNLCETKKDVCELYEADENLQRCQEELKCKICGIENNEYTTKSNLINVTTQVNSLSKEVDKLSEKFAKCQNSGNDRSNKLKRLYLNVNKGSTNIKL